MLSTKKIVRKFVKPQLIFSLSIVMCDIFTYYLEAPLHLNIEEPCFYLLCGN